MGRVCQVTGKKTKSGNNVSHALMRTIRREESSFLICTHIVFG